MKKKIALPVFLSIGVLAMAGVSFSATGCSSSKPGFCSDVTTLKASVKNLTNIDINANTLNQVQTNFDQVQTDAQAAVDSAKADFPQETQRLENAINGTKTEIQNLPSNPDAAQLVTLGAQVLALGQAAKDFQSAVSSACN